MYAVVETGGKQYKMAPGAALRVEKLEGRKGDEVTFSRVLMIGEEGGTAQVGTPVLEGATVTARVMQQGMANKVLVFKYKKRKRYRVKRGHRQPFTLIKVGAINA